jgi:hypothetical protein
MAQPEAELNTTNEHCDMSAHPLCFIPSPSSGAHVPSAPINTLPHPPTGHQHDVAQVHRGVMGWKSWDHALERAPIARQASRTSPLTSQISQVVPEMHWLTAAADDGMMICQLTTQPRPNPTQSQPQGPVLLTGLAMGRLVISL